MSAIKFLLSILGLCIGLTLVACSDDNSETAAQRLTGSDALISHGSQKSRMCTACHGPVGISRVASYPSLAGKPEAYLAQQLHAFRSGARENPMMSSIAKNLSDNDIAALAHYYASLSAAEVDEVQK